MSDFTFYILAFVAVVACVLVAKKVAGCFIKSILLLLLLGAGAACYFFFRG
ncbi:MAG: hypothetical protein ACI4BA_08320 [Prevotella sp.]